MNGCTIFGTLFGAIDAWPVVEGWVTKGQPAPTTAAVPAATANPAESQDKMPFAGLRGDIMLQVVSAFSRLWLGERSAIVLKAMHSSLSQLRDSERYKQASYDERLILDECLLISKTGPSLRRAAVLVDSELQLSLDANELKILAVAQVVLNVAGPRERTMLDHQFVRHTFAVLAGDQSVLESYRAEFPTIGHDTLERYEELARSASEGAGLLYAESIDGDDLEQPDKPAPEDEYLQILDGFASMLGDRRFADVSPAVRARLRLVESALRRMTAEGKPAALANPKTKENILRLTAAILSSSL